MNNKLAVTAATAMGAVNVRTKARNDRQSDISINLKSDEVGD